MDYLYIAFVSFFSICCGVMAKRKNRHIILWMLLGVIGGLISYLIIAFLPYLCPYCQENYAKNSDGVHCGSCGKSNVFSEKELAKLDTLKGSFGKQGASIKTDGVKITLTQSSGAKMSFIGIEKLEQYAKQ